MTSPSLQIVHEPERLRFVARTSAGIAVCAYRRHGDTVDFTYTGVPPALQGQGIAAELVRVALAWAVEQGLTVRPLCSYVAVYLRRHPPAAA